MSYYYFKAHENITLPRQANNPAIVDILQGYTPATDWNINFSDNMTEIIIGNGKREDVGDYEYVINVTEDGIYVNGKSYKDTVRGFVSLMELIFCYGKNDFRAECALIRDRARLPFRSIHLCFFPENTVEEMRRVIRSCGMAKYTHIVLEFWGFIKLDCLKELSWPEGYTKDEIRPLVAEAHALGMEIIPFFQHLGHAALSRLGYSGKHVVLDQNPALEYLYYPKSRGWVWNFMSDEVRDLLRKVRHELMELCGESQYFHLGCDESGLEFDSGDLTSYLNEVSEELKAEGRRAIVWGDMLLSRRFDGLGGYECNSTPEYATALLEGLSRDVIVADWQYNVKERPWKSSAFLKDKGFDVLCCPWHTNQYNSEDAIVTVEQDGHFGLMITTWNKLFTESGIPRLVFAGLCAWGDPAYRYWFATIGERSYNIYRKASPKNLSYEDCGWSKHQI